MRAASIRLAVLFCLLASGPATVPGGAAERTITVSNYWGSPGANPQADALVAIAARFEAAHPDTSVELVWGVNPDKLTTMIAGGSGPDVAALGAQYVVEYGASGQLIDLTPWIRQAGMSLSTFIPPAVAQLGWRGAQFGLPWLTNITFGTAVNRDLLAQAGFDPEGTPVYVSDVEAINRKMTRFDVEGRVVQLGMPPHLYTGEPANTLTSWGFAFGGGFWDSRDQRFTTDRPENAAALEWLLEQKQRYLPDDDTSLLRAASGPVFGGGRIGVILIHTSAATDLHHHFPDLDWRLGPQPYLEDGGHRNPLWLSGPALTITRDSEDPEAAFAFVRYATTHFDALEALVSVGRSLPGVLEPRAIWEVVRRDRALAPWVDMLADVRFSRPPVPNQRFWVATLNERVRAVLNGRLPAATALAEAQRLVSEDLSRFR